MLEVSKKMIHEMVRDGYRYTWQYRGYGARIVSGGEPDNNG